MQEERSARIQFIDLAKGFCILAVLWYHVRFDMPASTIEYTMRNVRMPLYFFLSGLFFKTYSGFSEFTLRKVNKLLVPFVFFFLISYMAGVICHFLGFYEKGIIQDPFEWTIIFEMFWKERYTYNAPIWFFVSLFEVSVGSYFLIEKLKSNYTNLIIAGFLCGSIGFGLNYMGIDLPLHVDTSLRYMPFFMIGYVVKQRSPLLYPNPYDKYIPLALLALGTLTYLLAPAEPLDNVLFHYISGLSGILFVILLSKKLVQIPVISYIGRYSLVVLGTHTFLVGPLRYVFSRIIPNQEMMFVATWIAIIAISMGIIPILIKLFPTFLAQKDLIPVKKQTKIATQPF
ncbi:MAG: acyltransferase [Bacteroidales bacterium]